MLKACVYTDSSKNGQSWDFEPRSQGFSVFSAVRFLKRLKRENNFAVLAHISYPEVCICRLLQN